jgi:Xaa-Pro aminopeptidase
MFDRLKRIMSAENLDALIATSPDNVYYLSKFKAQEPYKTYCPIIFPRDGEPILLLPKSEEGFIPSDCLVKDKRFYGEFYILNRPEDIKSLSKDLTSAVSHTIKEMHLDKSTLGFEEKHMPYNLVKGLKQKLPDVKFKFASGVFEEARMIKDDEEIKKITNTVKIAKTVLLEAYKSAYEGESELQLAKNLNMELIKRDAETLFIELGAGIRCGFPTFPSEYKIKRGDVVHVDFAISYNGYCSDISRNAVLLEEKEEYLKINEALKTAHEKIVDILKPGLKISEIFKAAVKIIRNKGIRNYNRHHVGHGIGVSPHEPPAIEATNERKLEPGMVLCIETPCYMFNVGGFNIENVIAIKDDGCEVISKLSQDIYILPIS